MGDAEPVPSGIIQLKPNELEIISNPLLGTEVGITEVNKVIYGRLLSGKSINKVGLKNLFETLWQNKAGIQIEDYNEGIITLACGSEAIKNRIMRGQPWQFADIIGLGVWTGNGGRLREQIRCGANKKDLGMKTDGKESHKSFSTLRLVLKMMYSSSKNDVF